MDTELFWRDIEKQIANFYYRADAKKRMDGMPDTRVKQDSDRSIILHMLDMVIGET